MLQVYQNMLRLKLHTHGSIPYCLTAYRKIGLCVCIAVINKSELTSLKTLNQHELSCHAILGLSPGERHSGKGRQVAVKRNS